MGIDPGETHIGELVSNRGYLRCAGLNLDLRFLVATFDGVKQLTLSYRVSGSNSLR